MSIEIQTNDGEPDVEVPASDDWFTDGEPLTQKAADEEWVDQLQGDEVEAASDWGLEVEPLVPPEEASKGVLPKLLEECQRRVEVRKESGNEEVSAWVQLDAPTERQMEESQQILGNWNDKPVKAGIAKKDLTEEKQADDPSIVTYHVYRSGKFNVHYRVREVTLSDEIQWNHVNSTDFNGEAHVTVPEKGVLEGTLRLVVRYEPIRGDPAEGWYTSDDSTITDAHDDLSVKVEGDIEPGEEVFVHVEDDDGEPVTDAGLWVEGPAEGMIGEVFVEEGT